MPKVSSAQLKLIPQEEIEKMIDDKIDKDLKRERLNHMIKENKTLEDLKQRYERIRKSWGKADTIVKVIGTIIALLSGTGLIVLIALGGMGLVPLATLTILESIFSSAATLGGFATIVVSMRWTKRKKKAFRARVKLIEEYQNKLFYYTQKVREDGIITVEELKQFDLLLAEFNNKLLEIKFKQTKKDYNMLSSMSQSGSFRTSKPGTFKEAPTEGAPKVGEAELCSAVASLVTEKERKKIDKEVQQQIKQEALFNARQEALLNAKKNLQLGITEVIVKGIPKELLREEQEQK